MAGAIEKKINQIRTELVGAPLTHIDARATILSDIALSREFSNTFLQALCLGHTGGKDESGSTATMALHVISKALAKQRMICYGAHTISTTFKSFSLPGHETVNGALTLTEANTSFFGYVCTTLDEKNIITLSNAVGEEQTIDGNTFSVYVRDYYMVRSRVSGELEPISGNVSAYTTPDGDDIVFGNTISWGGSISGEQEANTWNYHWAKANIASTAIKNSGGYLELNTLTLTDHLNQGSNTDYTPVGPGFNDKFYLKRHADSVNTFTISGTTTTDSEIVTDISEADILKIKSDDVISGTGISGAPTITGVQSTKSLLRMSNSATADGTVTITVNSVPFGHAAHDIFCQVEVSTEGLVANTTWTPVGDDAGTYPANSEDDLCTANTSQFIALLGFFDPAGSSDLAKGASGLYSSSGKIYAARAGVGDFRMLLEDGSTTTPSVSTEGFLLINSTDGSADASDNILTEEYVTSVGAPVEDTGFAAEVETNPFKPANQGTTATFTVKEGEMTGTQPDGFTDKDVYLGRFVAWTKDRSKANTDADPVVVVPEPEYRYITDSAEKFFYAPARSAAYRCGSVTSIVGETIPGVGLAPAEVEPRAVLPRTGLASVVTLIRADETLAASTNASQSVVPLDDVITTPTANSTTGSVPADTNEYTYRVSGGVIKRGGWNVDYSGPTANSTGGDEGTLTQGFTSAGRTAITPVDYNIVSNYVARKLTTDGSTANADVAFVTDVIDSLQSVAQFRDPVSTSNIANPGFTDAAFDTYICATTGTNAVDAALADIKSSLTAFATEAELAGRVDGCTAGFGAPSGQDRGTAADFDNFSSQNGHAKWVTFSTAVGTLQTNLNNRIAEIDARIGVPVYANSTSTGTTPATRGNPPCIRVKTIPAANTTDGYVPYGRSIYDNINLLLANDVDLMGGIIKDIESLTDIVQLVKNARNKYEIYNGRIREY